MINKIKMKRHESFTIREGWLSKGLIAIRNNDKAFSSENATDILGIGTNMVKSLKYWLYATCLITDNKNKIEITEFGKLILRYDPYMEDFFTWWMIHIKMVLNQKDFYVGNLFFNKIISKHFSKKNVYDTISESLVQSKIDYNESILNDEINVVIKTYVMDESNENPENNFNCPLADLELLKRINKDNYENLKPNYRNLDYKVVYYLLLNIVNDREYISIDELLKCDNSPIRVLNLDKSLCNDYLDDIRRAGLIDINRTAGLNMIYIVKKMSLSELFSLHYGRR